MRDLIGSAILAVLIVCGPTLFIAILGDRAEQQTVIQERPERHMVCYDYRGRVTTGEDWKECRLEAVQG